MTTTTVRPRCPRAAGRCEKPDDGIEHEHYTTYDDEVWRWEVHEVDDALYREPDPEAMRRISAHLLGEDIVNIRAVLESFGNGYTVVRK